MSTLDFAFENGLAEVLQAYTKTSAQKARSVARNLAGSGGAENMARAQQIMSAPGVVPSTSGGVPFKTLGKGGEGLAELAQHPQNGMEVKKTFNPQGGVYSPEVADRKAQIGPELNSNPDFAKFYGADRTTQGTPVHHNEFVQGQRPSASESRGADFEAMKGRAETAGRATGHELLDIRGANTMKTPDGQMKIIDHMPMRPNEALPQAQRNALVSAGHESVLPITQEGHNLFPNAGESNANGAQIKALAHGGVDPQRPRQAYAPKQGPQLSQAKPEPTPPGEAMIGPVKAKGAKGNPSRYGTVGAPLAPAAPAPRQVYQPINNGDSRTPAPNAPRPTPPPMPQDSRTPAVNQAPPPMAFPSRNPSPRSPPGPILTQGPGLRATGR